MKKERTGPIMKEGIQYALISHKIRKKGNIKKKITYSSTAAQSQRLTLNSYITAFYQTHETRSLTISQKNIVDQARSSS